MSFNAFSRFSHSKTPSFLKVLLLTIGSLSLGLSLLMILFKGTFPFNPHLLFGLSLEGIKNGLIFQIFTYPILQLPSYHFDTGYLIHLFFNIYILWLTGSGIIERKGTKSLITIILSSILTIGLMSLALMAFSPFFYVLIGNTTLVFTLLMAWIMLYPDVRIMLFFVIPMQAKHLILGLLGFSLIMDLSNEHYLKFAVCLFAGLYGYLYALLIWKAQNPFSFLKPLEERFTNIKSSLKKAKKEKTFHASKIYDFKTGEPVLDDDQFMDAMLTKINLYGKESLSAKEKKRMDQISKK